jgi:hypothetical protein
VGAFKAAVHTIHRFNHSLGAVDMPVHVDRGRHDAPVY